MQDSIPTTEGLALLQSLDITELQHNATIPQLSTLLQQADVHTAGLNTLHTESKFIIAKLADKVADAWKRLQINTEPVEKEYKVFRRETPVLSTRIPASTPLWANGAKPAYSLGPYLGIDGRQFWFDFYQYEKLIPVYITGDSNPIMLLPVKISFFQLAAPTKFTITQGSIWMRADLFAAGLTNKQYAGVNVSSGTLTFTTAHSVENNSIHISPAESFALTLTLNNTFSPTGSGPDGIDAREATITLPATANFQFAAGKFQLQQLGGASWKLYGDSRNFNWQPGGVIAFNAFLNRLTFELHTDVPDFTAVSFKSAFFSITGKCKVMAAGWALNVGTLDVNKPFAVGNNGALGLVGGEGLLYKWKGLDTTGGDVKMKLPFILAEPGKFSIADITPQFKQHTELYKLWKRDTISDIATTAELRYQNSKPFIYYCDEAGTEMVSALANADLQTDKPFCADGRSVSPRTKDSIYLKYTTPALKGIYLYDFDMVAEMMPAFIHLSKPEVYQFSLVNAYLMTTPPAGILLTGQYNAGNELTKGNLSILYGLFTIVPTLPHPYTANILLANNAISAEQLRSVKDVKEWAQFIKNFALSTCNWDSNMADANGDTVTVDFELVTDLFKQLAASAIESATADAPPATFSTHLLSGAFTGLQIKPLAVEESEQILSKQTIANSVENSNISAVGNTAIKAAKEGVAMKAALDSNALAAATAGISQSVSQDYEQQVSDFLIIQRNFDFYNKTAYSLLDLSTHYDLFGISLSFNNRLYRSTLSKVSGTGQANTVTIDNLNLQAPMAMLKAFTLPHISWEPLNNLTEPDISKDPPQGILSFPDNGLPTLFSLPDPKPVNIDPLAHLKRFKENLNAAGKLPGSNIIFSLPHGKLSLALLSYFNPTEATVKNNFDFIQPAFEQSKTALTGGLQFRIASSKKSGRHRMLGMTNQLRNVVGPSGIQQDMSILGESVHSIFQDDFFWNFNTEVPEVKVDGVPVTHTDFSGYGASMFSDWLNPQAQIAQTSEVRFDVMTGRVAHEVVQVVSIVYPWGIKVVRTITFHRNANAVIYREDSGWVAQSDGLFDFSFHGDTSTQKDQSFDNPFSFHPGLIGGLLNVHNIKELEEDPIEIKYTFEAGDYGWESQKKQVIVNPSGPSTALFQAITFDADVALEDIMSAKTNGKVTGKSFKGYVQLKPPGVPVPPRVLAELFSRQQNAIGGTVDCIMKIGGSDQLHKINRIDASASYQKNNTNDKIFIVAAKGSVQLPAEGSWSMVEVDKTSGNVSPVTNKASVPVIRRGERDRKNKPFTIIGNDKIVRVAFPDALVDNTNFAKRYGYVQNTGSQKLLLTDPKVNQSAPAELKTEAPLLADAYRLLNSKGPFPNLANVLKIENVTEAVTSILPAGLRKTITDFPVPAGTKFDIIGKDGDNLHMYIKYESNPSSGGKSPSIVNYLTDSSLSIGDKFSNQLKNLSISVDLGPFKKLLTVSGNFQAATSLNSSMESGDAPQLKLCKELEPIYEILEFLANLDPSNPVDAIKRGLKIAMSNTADSWEYKFKAEKEIPLVKFPFDPINYNAPTTPLKLDAYFRIGCYFNQPIKIPDTIDQLIPSAGAYLELGADLRIMCFSLGAATIYATGRAQVGLAADVKSPPSLYFKFGFGIELCVGLPVIGSVSVMYLVGVDMKLTTVDLTVGAFMYFRGRAEIFAGIVTITIQIEASGKIKKQLSGGPCNCIAVCTFALDISIFLIIDISFSETWEETRQIA